MTRKIVVTSALPYANGPIHIGHLVEYLQTDIWVRFQKLCGNECYYFCGLSDRPPERTMLVPEAFFGHPKIKNIQDQCFKVYRRSSELTGKIHSMRRLLKHAIYNFVKKFHIDLIIAENCLAIPMNVPLGLALTEFIAETGMPTIAHHHDFFWERPRFFVNAIADLINMAFPPGLHSIQHVVINTQADRELSYRTGISPTVIPNVLDFKKPSPGMVYPLLQRLEELGYVSCELIDKGHERKIYTITPDGKELCGKLVKRVVNIISTSFDQSVHVCVSCGCRIIDGGYTEIVSDKKMTFCCSHCADAYKET